MTENLNRDASSNAQRAHTLKLGQAQFVVRPGTTLQECLADAATFVEVARGLWSASSAMKDATVLARESIETAHIFALEAAQTLIAAAHDANGAAHQPAQK